MTKNNKKVKKNKKAQRAAQAPAASSSAPKASQASESAIASVNTSASHVAHRNACSCCGPSGPVDDLATRLRAIMPLSKECGGLTAKVLAHVIAELAEGTEWSAERLQHDIASIRLASKLLCEVATPHFYKVIKVTNPAGVFDLVDSLQDQPQLCATTRAIWWGAMQDCSPEKPLVRFPNVTEVAYCIELRLPGMNCGVAVGEHFALRDKGAWCEGVGAGSYDMAGWMQGTPTLSMIQELDLSHSRAVWGVHLVIPTAKDMLRPIPRTVTHVALSFYEHPHVNNMDLEAAFSTLLDVRQYPLLRQLKITLLNFGMPKGRVPTAEDRALNPSTPLSPAGIEMQAQISHAERVLQLNEALRTCPDPRVVCELFGNVQSGTRADTRFQDVSEHTLMNWRHRVYFRRGRLWRGTPMVWPSTDY